MPIQPPTPTYGGYEEVGRIGGHEILLRAEGSVAPDADAAVAVMVVAEHGEELSVHAERRFSPGDLLLGIGKREAYPAEEGEHLDRIAGRFRGSGAEVDLRGTAELQLRTLLNVLIDLDPELLRARHDRTFEADAVDRSDDAMAVSPGTEA
jgi:hypothetical protein